MTTTANSYENPIPANDPKLLSVNQVTEITGLADSTIYRRTQASDFPSPQRVWAISANGHRRLSLRWDREIIEKWMVKNKPTGLNAPRRRAAKPTPPDLETPARSNQPRGFSLGLPGVVLGAGAMGAILTLSTQSLLRFLGAN
jgi:predicted DNA-binding transcriptional regulator AlpA